MWSFGSSDPHLFLVTHQVTKRGGGEEAHPATKWTGMERWPVSLPGILFCKMQSPSISKTNFLLSSYKSRGHPEKCAISPAFHKGTCPSPERRAGSLNHTVDRIAEDTVGWQPKPKESMGNGASGTIRIKCCYTQCWGRALESPLTRMGTWIPDEPVKEKRRQAPIITRQLSLQQVMSPSDFGMGAKDRKAHGSYPNQQQEACNHMDQRPSSTQ